MCRFFVMSSPTTKVSYVLLCLLYTMSQKNIPDILDCNLQTNYHILIIFDTTIPDTTSHQMTVQFPISTNVCFCTTWGKPNQRNITFYPIRYDCLINITHENAFCSHFWHFGWQFIQLYIFSTDCSKTAWSGSALCEHRQSDAFSIHW